MVYYELVKFTINIPGLAKVIINVVLYYYVVPKLIIMDWNSLFISKFLSLLCNFLRIKKKLSIAFHPKTNGRTEKQNSPIEIFLKVFVNKEQNNCINQLPIVEFPYNNAKNTSISHTLFKLNYGHHLKVLLEKDIDSCLRSCSTDKLTKKLRKLIEVYYQNLLHA